MFNVIQKLFLDAHDDGLKLINDNNHSHTCILIFLLHINFSYLVFVLKSDFHFLNRNLNPE